MHLIFTSAQAETNDYMEAKMNGILSNRNTLILSALVFGALLATLVIPATQVTPGTAVVAVEATSDREGVLTRRGYRNSTGLLAMDGFDVAAAAEPAREWVLTQRGYRYTAGPQVTRLDIAAAQPAREWVLTRRGYRFVSVM